MLDEQKMWREVPLALLWDDEAEKENYRYSMVQMHDGSVEVK